MPCFKAKKKYENIEFYKLMKVVYTGYGFYLKSMFLNMICVHKKNYESADCCTHHCCFILKVGMSILSLEVHIFLYQTTVLFYGIMLWATTLFVSANMSLLDIFHMSY